MAALFSVEEARAFDKAQLASDTDYPDAVIEAKEEEIRTFFARVCGVDFVPTIHIEAYDGDGSDFLVLGWPQVTEVSAILIDGVELTEDEINPNDYAEGLAVDTARGVITRRSGYFPSGWQNIDVTYTAGHEEVPPLIKRAALMVCVEELASGSMPWQATGYSEGDVSYSFARGDGYGDNWHRIPDVVKAIRAYSMKIPGIA